VDDATVYPICGKNIDQFQQADRLDMILDSQNFQNYLLVWARIVPLVLFSPALGSRMLSAKTRMFVAATLAFIVSSGTQTVPINRFWQSIVVQIIIGCVMAVLSSIPFYAFQSLGEWIDSQRGETLSMVIVPQLESRSSPLGRLFLITAVSLFFSSNSHHILILQIIESFNVISLESSDMIICLDTQNKLCYELLTKQMADLFAIVVKIGLPVVFILWITDVVLGILNRIAPALQVFFIGLPMKMWIGLAMLGITIGFAIAELYEYIEHSIAAFA
jgi:flagellar biosynthesis protein FliR